MMIKRARPYFFMMMIVLLISCEPGMKEDKSPEDNTTPNEQDYIKMMEPNNMLEFALLENIEPDENQNIFISPTSALMAVLMAYNGAEGETKEEIAEALAIDQLSMEETNMATAAVLNKLNDNLDMIELSIANSLWLNDNLQFTDTFIQKTDDYFQAKLFEIDVDDDASVRKINDWVSDATNGKIEDIIEGPIHPAVVAFLINALYFNGTWMYEFDEVRTEDFPFQTAHGEKNVSFMMIEQEFDYFETEMFQAVKIPYGDGKMSMNVFLPQAGVSLIEVMEGLTVEKWNEWQTKFKETEGTIKLPKFQLEYETKLNNAFKQLGIELAFDEENANFPHMIEKGEPRLWIEEIKQKTFIDVTEKGTEAAGATSVEMRTTSATIEDNFYMDINRPFLFTITHEEMDINLFVGTISNPKQR